jgi:hypothetical protein
MTRMEAGDRKPFAEALARATSSLSGPDLDAALDEIGWRDALPVYAADAVSILFENQGRARAQTGALEAVLANAGGMDTGTPCVVLPPLGGTDAPGTFGRSGLDVYGLALPSIATAQSAWVVTGAGTEYRAISVNRSALTVQPVRGMDPSLGLCRIEVSGIPEQHCTAAATGLSWSKVVAAGQLALAHELIGLSRSMLEMAREHALAREQFGRPIASFQAVRHRLAESLIAIEGADSAASAAWDSPGPLSASIAKSLAGQGARTVAKHAQQVLAGMGFTSEHGFQQYFKRALVLDHLLGSSRSLTESLGRHLLATRELPDMLPL